MFEIFQYFEQKQNIPISPMFFDTFVASTKSVASSLYTEADIANVYLRAQ